MYLNFSSDPNSFYPVGQLASIPLLIATIILLFLIKRQRTRQGMVVISYVITLMMAFVARLATQMYSIQERTLCVVTGYVTQICFLATFFWLNIMCFEVWGSFMGLRKMRVSTRDKDLRTFGMYLMYACICPSVIFFFTLLMEFNGIIQPESEYKPRVGEIVCFFTGAQASWLYFYAPVSALLICNIMMFTTTGYRIFRYKNLGVSIHLGQTNQFNDYRENFRDCVILLGSVFIYWLSELIFIVWGSSTAAWYATEITTFLQAFVIFFLFACNKKHLKIIDGSTPPSQGSNRAPQVAVITSNQ